jgi:hypothetical protein
MTIKTNQIQEILKARGNVPFHATKKKQGFKLNREVTIYVNLASVSGVTALVVQPDSGIERLRDKVANLKIGTDYYHSSNLNGFPKRQHGGKSPITFGVGLTFESEAAVEACLKFLEK